MSVSEPHWYVERLVTEPGSKRHIYGLHLNSSGKKKLTLLLAKSLNNKNVSGTTNSLPKLRASCYAIRLTVHVSNINTLKSIYCACFHYVIKYGIWGGGGA
jgi:hypothetical protein